MILPNPVVVLAVHDYLSNLGGGEVAQAQVDEFALLVQLVQLLQWLCEGQATVGSVQVELYSLA